MTQQNDPLRKPMTPEHWDRQMKMEIERLALGELWNSIRIVIRESAKDERARVLDEIDKQINEISGPFTVDRILSIIRDMRSST